MDKRPGTESTATLARSALGEATLQGAEVHCLKHEPFDGVPDSRNLDIREHEGRPRRAPGSPQRPKTKRPPIRPRVEMKRKPGIEDVNKQMSKADRGRFEIISWSEFTIR